MKVTAIIPTLAKNKDYLEVCVKSLLETTDFDIIVSINGEWFGEGELIPEWLEDDRIGVMYTREQGQCNAVNVAASAVFNSPYLFISNDDMYYAPNWLIESDKWPLVWSPNLVEPTDNNGSAPPFLKLDAGFTLAEFDKEKVDEFVAGYLSQEVENGFNFPFFIKTEVFNAIGGFDTEYDPWGSNSDTDFQTKIEIAGIKPKRYRDSLVYHFSNKSGTFDGTHQVEWQKNFDYYREKFGYTRDDEPKADTWYCKNMVLKDKLIYHPEWEGKYARS